MSASVNARKHRKFREKLSGRAQSSFTSHWTEELVKSSINSFWTQSNRHAVNHSIYAEFNWSKGELKRWITYSWGSRFRSMLPSALLRILSISSSSLAVASCVPSVAVADEPAADLEAAPDSQLAALRPLSPVLADDGKVKNSRSPCLSRHKEHKWKERNIIFNLKLEQIWKDQRLRQKENLLCIHKELRLEHSKTGWSAAISGLSLSFLSLCPILLHVRVDQWGRTHTLSKWACV